VPGSHSLGKFSGFSASYPIKKILSIVENGRIAVFGFTEYVD